MRSHRCRISKNYEFHAGTCYCHVHTSQIAQKADFTAVVRANKRDKNNVALLTLEPVYRINAYQATVGTEELFLAYHLAQKLHLGTVRRDDANVD